MKNMINKELIQKEIDNNYEEFQKLLPELFSQNAGKFALLKDRKVVGIFDTMLDALSAGKLAFSDGLFSVQEIKFDKNVNLGLFSTSLAY